MCKKKTQEEFEKEVFELVGDEYRVLGKYINGQNKNKNVARKMRKRV